VSEALDVQPAPKAVTVDTRTEQGACASCARMRTRGLFGGFGCLLDRSGRGAIGGPLDLNLSRQLRDQISAWRSRAKAGSDGCRPSGEQACPWHTPKRSDP
jgi:hypothetical protein